LIPEMKMLIEGLALQRPSPTIAFVHRQSMAIATEKGWHAPSYRTVYDVINSKSTPYASNACKISMSCSNCNLLETVKLASMYQIYAFLDHAKGV
jgi:hypothetical protein